MSEYRGDLISGLQELVNRAENARFDEIIEVLREQFETEPDLERDRR